MADCQSLSNFDWSDITPVAQDEGPHPVCQVLYDSSCKALLSLIIVSDTRLMDIFRALLLCNEFSERVLCLTMDLLKINGSHYTIWYVLRSCVTCTGITEDSAWIT